VLRVRFWILSLEVWERFPVGLLFAEEGDLATEGPGVRSVRDEDDGAEGEEPAVCENQA
jgi:hypothetical protein